MEASVRTLRIPQSTGVNFGYTWEQLGAAVTCLGVLVTSLGALLPWLRAQAADLGAPRITIEQSGLNNFFFGNTGDAPGNYSYHILFNNF
jgi:hypothetical protein